MTFAYIATKSTLLPEFTVTHLKHPYRVLSLNFITPSLVFILNPAFPKSMTHHPNLFTDPAFRKGV